MSVNKVILIGNVGKDPDIRYFEANRAAANFTLATTERAHKGANDQIIPERTEWHNIVAWRANADVAERFIHKGTQIYVEGRLRTRSYQDQSGVKKYTTEIQADTIQLLGRRPEGEGAPQQGGYQSQGGYQQRPVQQQSYGAPQQPAYTAPQQPAYQAPQPQYSAPQQPAYSEPVEDAPGDDLPF